MPAKDITLLEEFWKDVQRVIKNGIELIPTKNKKGDYVVKNNLPGKNSHSISHIRPHASRAFYQLENGVTYGRGSLVDADELPDGRFMTKQCFWLNNSYVLSVIKDLL